MTDSVALNVVVSLVFIFLLYSLLVTIVNEIIASLFRLRSKTLQKGIRRMLTDDGTTVNSLVDSFFNQPAIKFLGEDNKNKKPSYLSSNSFAKGLFEMCKGFSKNKTSLLTSIQGGISYIKSLNPETGRYLESLLEDAMNDTDKFRELVELWFNETMDRATGWYKKQTQRITFMVGFFVALSFNVDSIQIVKHLSFDAKLSGQLADMAVKYADTHKDASGKTASEANTEVTHYFNEAKKLTDNEIAQANTLLGLGWDFRTEFDSFQIFYSMLGLLITALAISLGAPFWFDILSKVVQLRSSKRIEAKPVAK